MKPYYPICIEEPPANVNNDFVKVTSKRLNVYIFHFSCVCLLREYSIAVPFVVDFEFDLLAILISFSSICQLCRALQLEPIYRLVWAVFWPHDPRYPSVNK